MCIEMTTLMQTQHHAGRPYDPARYGAMSFGSKLAASLATRPVAGQQIVFAAHSATLCTATTNNSGVARCTLSLWNELRVVIANSYTASFAGNGSFAAANASTPAVIL
jgi:hypothetical protein